jgi:hypothetical protein
MYQNLQLFNQADTPCYYKAIADPAGYFKISLQGMLDKLSNQIRPIMAAVSNNPPPMLSELKSLEDVREKDEKECKMAYSANRLFLMDEFKDMSNLILESTLFNIISEAIYLETDLCSIGKTYIRVKPSID